MRESPAATACRKALHDRAQGSVDRIGRCCDVASEDKVRSGMLISAEK